ncbi:MAG: MerR family transcriptional regulator [Spirochaetes bacterium]|nr:MerR family transcriptional regulator [Spirochaetota bacterium]MBN2771965.1 MerR family transcriptional regulator [Spirochaetota bacterium]
MYSIGEFSRITRLTTKTLRHYHQWGILLPDHVDDDSGYRYYRPKSVERAFLISELRRLEFSIADIREILASSNKDCDLLEHLQSRSSEVKNLAVKYHRLEEELETAINTIRSNEMKESYSLAIKEKIIEDMLFAGYRYTGRYDQVGKAFSIIWKNCGRFVNGKAMTLYYDAEYKERDADIEGGCQVREGCALKKISDNNINVHKIEGGRAVTLIHSGRYEDIGTSYKLVFDYIRDRGYDVCLPTREIYLKGPGIFFKGNPDKYKTEIQIFLKGNFEK